MDYLEIISLFVLGWVSGAESGSWACVHPVLNKLPPEQQIIIQKGLLKTFGRVMPVLMPLSFTLVITLFIGTSPKNDITFYLRLAATILMGSMMLTTILFNVPINIATSYWSDNNLSADWKKKRKRWRFFQGYRSIILVLSFVLVIISAN